MKASRKIVLGIGGLIAVSAGLLQVDSNPTSAARVQAVEPVLDVNRFTKRADLIFKGTVTKVEYRNAESVPERDASGAPVLEDDGTPVLVDGSGLPHTFVTFRVDRAYKGRAVDRSLTLRFLGGSFQDGTPGRGDTQVLEVGHYPQFDIGDQDILFAEGNNDKPCPLVRCENSRFRFIGGNRNRSARIFTDLGHEVLRVVRTPTNDEIPDSDLATGKLRELPQVNQNTVGDSVFHRVVIPASEPDGDPVTSEPRPFVRGPHFTAEAFEAYILSTVQRQFTRAELRALPPVRSADISQPIQPDPATDATPPRGDEQDPLPFRPSLAELPETERNTILEQERLERQAYEANDGDPVLPAGNGG